MANKSGRIVSLVPFATFPPHMGGQIVIDYQNRELAHMGWQVTQFSAGFRRPDFFHLGRQVIKELASGYVEYRNLQVIPAFSFMTSALFHMPYFWAGKVVSRWHNLKRAIKKSDLILFEMPWCYHPDLLSPHSIPVIYMSHNLEHEVVQSWICKIKKIKKFVVDKCTKQEALLSQRADRIVAISQRDADNILTLYKIEKQKLIVIPRGIDLSQYPIISTEERINLRKKLEIHDDQKVVLFVGSKHGPNIEAGEFLTSIVDKIDPAGVLVIAGGVAGEIKHSGNSRVRLYEENNKFPFINIADYMKIADIAVNPIMTGSGLNVKVLEYMGWMLPVVTTPFGARGIKGMNDRDFVISEQNDFPSTLNALLRDEARRHFIGKNGRMLMGEEYSIQSTTKQLNQLFLELLRKK